MGNIQPNHAIPIRDFVSVINALDRKAIANKSYACVRSELLTTNKVKKHFSDNCIIFHIDGSAVDIYNFTGDYLQFIASMENSEFNENLPVLDIDNHDFCDGDASEEEVKIKEKTNIEKSYEFGRDPLGVLDALNQNEIEILIAQFEE